MSMIEKILSLSQRLSFPMNWLKQILWAENPLHSQQHRQLLYSENLHETPTLNSSQKVSIKAKDLLCSDWYIKCIQCIIYNGTIYNTVTKSGLSAGNNKLD